MGEVIGLLGGTYEEEEKVLKVSSFIHFVNQWSLLIYPFILNDIFCVDLFSRAV